MSDENEAPTQTSNSLPPEAIDALVIQLDSAFSMAGPGVPDYVNDAGKNFISALNRWSDEKKKAQ